MKTIVRLLVLLAVAGPALAQAPAPAPAARRPLLMPGKTSLFQRVIARPGATISPGPSAVNAQPLAGFSVLYVYQRQGGDNGWIEVGSGSDGRTQGWIPAPKAVEWRHTMVASFTNPAGRKPVLFLDSERAERLLMLDRDAGSMADQMRTAAAAGNPGSLVATEPANYVDINHNFYLLPILDAELIERESGAPLRLLKVISAPADAPPPPPNAGADALHTYKAAVVFLIDTTMSMQPYIEATRDAVRDLVAKIGTTAVKNNFRFGVIGYRDSLEDNPGLEYPAKVFAKPDFTQAADAVVSAMSPMRESRVSSTGFDEDPIGGIKAALDEIDWNNLGGRFVILVTDAGSRPSTHPHSVTRLGISEIKELAKAKQVALMTIHLLTPEGARRHDHEPAAAQYRELTRFGAADSLYFPVPGGTPDAFHATVEALSLALLQQVAAATGVPLANLQSPGAAPPTAAQDRMREQVRIVSEAMRLSYLGRAQETRAPDIRASWTTDRDLNDTNISSLDVRVLLTKNQLSDLAQALTTILQAGLAGRTEPQAFFTQLRSAFAAAATDPQRIAQATNIGALLGEYLTDLPYKSEIMDIDQDAWLSMGPIQQRVVLNNVESHLRLYREFMSETDFWHDITHSGLEGEKVFPVPIEALP